MSGSEEVSKRLEASVQRTGEAEFRTTTNDRFEQSGIEGSNRLKISALGTLKAEVKMTLNDIPEQSPLVAKRLLTPDATRDNAFEMLDVLATNRDDGHTATHELLGKFDALTSQWSPPLLMHQAETPRLINKLEELERQWSATSETPRLINELGELERQWTPRLINKLGELERQWSEDSESPFNTIQIGLTDTQQQQPRPSSSWSVQSKDSSLGRTTLSSHETCLAATAHDSRQAAFERLYRNDKRYKPRVRRRNSPPQLLDEERQQSFPGSLGSPTNSLDSHSYSSASASLEKRLSYVAPGDVRRIRQQQRREANSVATPTSAKTDSVFERLYRKEPRAKSSVTPKSRLNLPIASRPIQSASRSMQSAETRKTAPSLTPTHDSVFKRSNQQELRPPPTVTRTAKECRSVKSTPAKITTSGRMHASAAASRHEPSSMASPASVASRNAATTDSVFERLYRKEQRPKNAATPSTKKASTSSAVTYSTSERLHRTDPRSALAMTTNAGLSLEKIREVISTPSASSVASAATDSVFERLNRKEPRPSRITTPGTTLSQSRSNSRSVSAFRNLRDPSIPSSESVSSYATMSVFERLHRKGPRPSRIPKLRSSNSVRSSPTDESPERRCSRSKSLSTVGMDKEGHRNLGDLTVDTGFGTVTKALQKKGPSPTTAAGTVSCVSSTTSSFSHTTPTSANENTKAMQQRLTSFGPHLRRKVPFTLERQGDDESSSMVESTDPACEHELLGYYDDKKIVPRSKDADIHNHHLERLDYPKNTAIRIDEVRVGDLENGSARSIQFCWWNYCAGGFRLVGGDPRAALTVTPHQHIQTEVECAALCIQGVWRKSHKMRLLQKKTNAALSLQATFRMHIQHSHFQDELSTMRLFAALGRAEATDQARKQWRNVNAKEDLIVQRDKCATAIQAKWRSCAVKKEKIRRYLHLQVMTDTDESCNSQQKNLSLQTAACNVQQHWGTLMISRRGDVAAITIQSAFRRFWVQRYFQVARVAAAKIHALFQNWLAIKQRSSDSASSHIAARFISCESRSAAVVIQAALLGKRIRYRLRTSNRAAYKLQRYWKRHRAAVQSYKDFSQSFEALLRLREINATMIQAKWRSFLAQASMNQHVVASTKIQSKWRGIAALVLLWKTRSAAVIIQAALRGKLVRYRLQAITVQTYQKRQRFAVQERDSLSRHRESSATTIQATWRSFLAQAVLHRHLAATRIQSRSRCWQRRLMQEQGDVLGFRSTEAVSQQLEPDALTEECRLQDMNVAATKLQTTCIIMMMDRSLSKLETANLLLHRSVCGKFSRSVAVFALLQINVVLRSSVIVSFCHIVDTCSAAFSGMIKKLEQLKSRARDLATVLVQCFVRGRLCRMKLPCRQRVAKQFFRVIPESSGSAFTTGMFSLRKRSLSRVAPKSELDHLVYVELVAIRAREIVSRKAETLAERHVAHLLGGNSSLRCSENEAPCLLRLAAQAKQARAGSPMLS